ncbi:MAG: biopolymer transporter ExbD [Chlamydiota bacterium]
MSIIPDDELNKQEKINLAPMVDFLFLVIAIFATLAVAKTTLFDSEVSLVKVLPVKEDAQVASYNPSFMVVLAVTERGEYKWISEFNEYYMESTDAIGQELEKQQKLGLLPKENERTKVLLHIDKNAKWEPVANLIFSVRKAGFKIHPVYEPERETSTL